MSRFTSPFLVLLVVTLLTSQLRATQTSDSNSKQVVISACPSGNDRNPPLGATRVTDYVEVENTGLLSSRTRLRADGRVTWRGGHILFPVSVTVKPETARAVIEAFRSREIWRLCRGYHGPLSGGVPSRVTTIVIGGRVRRISESDDLAPHLLRDLDRRVESLVVPLPLSLKPSTPVSNAFFQLISDPAREVNAVRELIGPDVNAADAYGWSLLMYLTQEPASVAQMKSMIAAGLNVNARSKTGETPLMLAASSRYFDPNWIRTLLDAGADAVAQSGDGQTVLMYLVNHLAIYPSASLGDPVEMLRSHGARTDIRDKAGLTVFDYWNEAMTVTSRDYQWIDASLRR